MSREQKAIPEHEKQNRLIDEVSPYLLQHAYNPVDWHGWGEEAFRTAAREDKMIFLSIGYATCHWCHVMEKESFEDPEVARVLNEHFVSIKVDREERPDLDQLYMTASQLLSGGGGWPLNLILTPDKRPFFAMTYIPREPRFGNPGIIEVLSGLARVWREDRENLLTVATTVTGSLGTSLTRGRSPQRRMLDASFQELLLRYDRVNGGFGGAPKFPIPHNLFFLLRYHRIRGDEKARAMVETTLRAMALGGMYDQLGFGLHRYATDVRWIVPHFEKMLYDQAFLALAFIEAWQLTAVRFYERIARECLIFVEREMTSPEGGFYSAKDADTRGEEGGYYLWTRKEIEDLLPAATFRIVAEAWHLTTAGNFIDSVSGERTGKNILYFARAPEELANRMGMSGEQFDGVMASARDALFEIRNRRETPLTDDKVLSDWNGLMIAAFARAGRAFSDSRFISTAEKAAAFILGKMRNGEGELLHRYRNGIAGIRGMAPDYAFLIFGLTDLYMATFRPKYLSTAVELQHTFDTQLWDRKNGGYFISAMGQEDLIARQKDLYDGAIPSANSMAFCNLLRLNLLIGDTSYEKKASDLAKLYTEPLNRSPASSTFFLSGLSGVFGPSTEVVIAEGQDQERANDMIRSLDQGFFPFTVVIKRTAENKNELAHIAPFTGTMEPDEGTTRAYVCRPHVCSKPVTSVKDMLTLVERM
jgi:hypothetical protein